jgi:hypothetical protein
VALGLRDPAACKLIRNGTVTDQCYRRVAVTVKDYPICDKVKYSSEKLSCKAQITLVVTQEAAEKLKNGTDAAYKKVQGLLGGG